MIMQIFEDIDIIGSKFHFYQGKTQKRKTIFGGFLTIFMLVICFILIILFGDDFFTRTNPVVTMSVENDLKYEFIDLKKENIFFAFRIEDYDGNSEEDENGIFRSKINDEYLSYHICNEDDYSDINWVKNYGILYCPEEKKFVGYWDSPNLYYFEIQIFFCEKELNIQLIILNVLP